MWGGVCVRVNCPCAILCMESIHVLSETDAVGGLLPEMGGCRSSAESLGLSDVQSM